MQNLVPLVNQIHDILYQSNLSNKLQLPQIVVLGAQSTGKSSILESILGKEILPRGKGIVTRRPIEIQLINIDDKKEWVEFLELKNEKFYDFTKVKKEIEEQTEKQCGSGKEISNQPIKIKFFSPNVVDLLLIDLPGLTKNPVGDQPKNIETLIRELIMPYIQNPNSLILAISKGNDDLANSESLKLARQVDSQGKRTLGVITQLDIMDKGHDIQSDLMNQTYPLELGYLQELKGAKDIEQKKTIQQQLIDEKQFFMEHKFYNKIHDVMGIPYLIKILNTNFIKQIKQSLPKIRDNLQQMLKINEQELRQYGNYNDCDEFKENKSLFLLKMLSKYSNQFQEIIKGKFLQGDHQELFGGSRIYYIFFQIFQKAIDQLNPFDQLTDDDIRTSIGNSNGLRPSLFVPEVAFENLVKIQIKKLLIPSIDCSHLVYEELRKIQHMINIPEIERFENLRKQITKVMDKVLNKCLIPTDEMINQLIDIELGFINTNHPDFVGLTNALAQLMQNDSQKNVDKSEQKIIFKDVLEPVKTDFKGYEHLNNQNKKIDIYNNKLVNIDGQKNSFISTFEGIGPDYKSVSILSNTPSQIKLDSQISKRENFQIEIIKKLIQSYFDVVKKNINDSIPKTIVTLLVDRSKNICERELISELYKTDLLENLLLEDDYILKMRDEAKKQIVTVRNCIGIINSIDSKF